MKKIYIYFGYFVFIYANKAYSWDVSFVPSAPEIQASNDTPIMLKFLSTFIIWGCAILAVYLLHCASKKLHDSNIGGFIKTLLSSFIVGSAPYFSQFFLYK